MSLGDELEANATSVEETFWIPTGTGAAAAIVLSGISDGQLVGIVIFEAASLMSRKGNELELKP